MTGVDPSLTSTGFAVITRTPNNSTEYFDIPERVFLTVHSFAPVKLVGTGAVAEAARVASIVDDCCSSAAGSIEIVIEGLALNSRTGKYAERAHLYYALVTAFTARRVPVESVPPTTLKKLVTGDGRASKEDMVTAVRSAWSDRGWVDGLKTGRFDRADAAGLAWIRAARLGWGVPPLPRSA